MSVRLLHTRINGIIRSEREPPAPRQTGNHLLANNFYRRRTLEVTSKMIFLAVALLLLASPIFAQTPGGAGGDLHLPFAYLAMGIASGLCGIGQGMAAGRAAEAMARNPGAQAGIRFALIFGLVLIESLALYTLVITFIAR